MTRAYYKTTRKQSMICLTRWSEWRPLVHHKKTHSWEKWNASFVGTQEGRENCIVGCTTSIRWPLCYPIQDLKKLESSPQRVAESMGGISFLSTVIGMVRLTNPARYTWRVSDRK